jgi:hypothetical protein
VRRPRPTRAVEALEEEEEGEDDDEEEEKKKCVIYWRCHVLRLCSIGDKRSE